MGGLNIFFDRKAIKSKIHPIFFFKYILSNKDTFIFDIGL